MNAARPSFLEIDFDGRAYACVAILDAPGVHSLGDARRNPGSAAEATGARRVAEALAAVAGRSKLVVTLDDRGVATVNGIDGWRITSTRFRLAREPAAQPFELHFHPRYAADPTVPYEPDITVYAISQPEA